MDAFAGEGGGVQGGDEFHRLPGVGEGDRGRQLSVERVEDGRELRRMAALQRRSVRRPASGDRGVPGAGVTVQSSSV